MVGALRRVPRIANDGGSGVPFLPAIDGGSGDGCHGSQSTEAMEKRHRIRVPRIAPPSLQASWEGRGGAAGAGVAAVGEDGVERVMRMCFVVFLIPHPIRELSDDI